MSANDDLLAAFEARDSKAATAAIKAGADPELVNQQRQMRVLEMAIALKWKGVIKLLIGKGASVTATDRRGRNTLHLLADGLPDVALGTLALDKGAPIDALDGVEFEKRAALHRAVKQRKLDFAEMLLERGADINVADGEDGYTPLHLIVKSESGGMSATEISTAFWLMRNGADVGRASTDYQVTPLHLAAGSGSIEVVRELIARGAKVALDEAGNTPLFYCLSTHKRCIDIWDTLIAAGCKVNHRNERGDTPLHEAQCCWNEFAVRYLLAKGADLAARDSEGKTALECARALGQDKIIKALAANAA